MEVKIKIPAELSDITLGQYQRFMSINENITQGEFLDQKMIEIFCEIPLKHVLLIQRKSVVSIIQDISKLFTEKYPLINTFKIKNQEFGFIPNLDSITQGEYIDINNYLQSWDTMHKAMAVLYRPIKQKKGNNYSIIDYQGTDEFSDLMKFMPLDAALGAYVFFWNLGNELLKATRNYLTDQLREVITVDSDNSKKAGGGITHSINLQEVITSRLIELPENLCTDALHFCPTKLKKQRLSKKSLINH